MTAHPGVAMMWSMGVPRSAGSPVGQVPTAPLPDARPASTHIPRSVTWSRSVGAPPYRLMWSSVALKSPAMITLPSSQRWPSHARSARQLSICSGMGETGCTAMMTGPFPSTGSMMTVGSTLVVPRDSSMR